MTALVDGTSSPSMHRSGFGDMSNKPHTISSGASHRFRLRSSRLTCLNAKRSSKSSRNTTSMRRSSGNASRRTSVVAWKSPMIVRPLRKL
jgi:hypothetical protein